MPLATLGPQSFDVASDVDESAAVHYAAGFDRSADVLERHQARVHARH